MSRDRPAQIGAPPALTFRQEPQGVGRRLGTLGDEQGVFGPEPGVLEERLHQDGPQRTGVAGFGSRGQGFSSRRLGFEQSACAQQGSRKPDVDGGTGGVCHLHRGSQVAPQPDPGGRVRGETSVRQLADPGSVGPGQAGVEELACNDRRRRPVVVQPSREVAVLMTTIAIQQRAGGDTVRALAELASTLDARKDVRREIATLLSGVVFTSYVVAGIGGATILLINAMSPGVTQDMTSSPLGIAGLVVALVLWTIAFVLIRRTTRIDV